MRMRMRRSAGGERTLPTTWDMVVEACDLALVCVCSWGKIDPSIGFDGWMSGYGRYRLLGSSWSNTVMLDIDNFQICGPCTIRWSLFVRSFSSVGGPNGFQSGRARRVTQLEALHSHETDNYLTIFTMTVPAFETTFAVPMTCEACIKDIEGSLSNLSGTSTQSSPVHVIRLTERRYQQDHRQSQGTTCLDWGHSSAICNCRCSASQWPRCNSSWIWKVEQ